MKKENFLKYKTASHREKVLLHEFFVLDLPVDTQLFKHMYMYWGTKNALCGGDSVKKVWKPLEGFKQEDQLGGKWNNQEWSSQNGRYIAKWTDSTGLETGIQKDLWLYFQGREKGEVKDDSGF